jgi:hypothetical protein
MEETVGEYSTRLDESISKRNEQAKDLYELKEKSNLLDVQAQKLLAERGMTYAEIIQYEKTFGQTLKQLGKDAEEQNAQQREYMETNVEITNALANRTGIQAEATRYLMNERILQQGLAGDIKEQSSLLQNQVQFVISIAEQFGISKSRAEQMIPILQNISEGEIKLLEARKNANEDMERTVKKNALYKMFPSLNSEFNSYLEMADALKGKIETIWMAGGNPNVKDVLQEQQYRAMGEAQRKYLEDTDPKKLAEKTSQAAQQMHDDVKNSLSSALSEAFDNGPKAE